MRNNIPMYRNEHWIVRFLPRHFSTSTRFDALESQNRLVSFRAGCVGSDSWSDKESRSTSVRALLCNNNRSEGGVDTGRMERRWQDIRSNMIAGIRPGRLITSRVIKRGKCGRRGRPAGRKHRASIISRGWKLNQHANRIESITRGTRSTGFRLAIRRVSREGEQRKRWLMQLNSCGWNFGLPERMPIGRCK